MEILDYVPNTLNIDCGDVIVIVLVFLEILKGKNLERRGSEVHLSLLTRVIFEVCFVLGVLFLYLR